MYNTIFIYIFLILCILPVSWANNPILNIEKIGKETSKTVTQSFDTVPPDTMAPHDFDEFEEAVNKIERENPSFYPHVKDITYLDPKLLNNINSCERDYSKDCPTSFQLLGKFNNSTECIADSNYNGPCTPTLSYQDSSVNAKLFLAHKCGVNWPCKRCIRDYSSLCPELFKYSSHHKTCVPTKQYNGPCQYNVSFEMHNKYMKDSWSHKCYAYFPCIKIRSGTTLTSLDLKSTLNRLL